MVDLVDYFKDEMNKVTVYRILSRMEKEGIIHSFNGNALEGKSLMESVGGDFDYFFFDQRGAGNNKSK